MTDNYVDSITIERTMKIAITGASGFIGKATLNALSSDPSVTEISALLSPRHQQTENLDSPKLRLISGNLSDRCVATKVVSGCEAVIHLANRGLPWENESDPEKVMEENLDSTSELVEACYLGGVKRLLFISTGGAMYRPLPNRGDRLDEEAAIELRTAYAASKRLVEILLLRYASMNAIQPTILRVASVYGEGRDLSRRSGFIPRLIHSAETNNPLPIWVSLETAKDFLYLKDCVAAFQSWLRHPEAPIGIYNVGSGRAHSLAEVIDVVESVTGRRVNLQKEKSQVTDVPFTLLNYAKFAKAFRWQPSYTLSDGIREMWHATEQTSAIAA